MLLWIVLTAMTSAAAVWLAAPFLRRLDESAGNANAASIYRDQLSEIERDKSSGLIDADQAEAASLEVKRRLLNAEQQGVSTFRLPSLGERHLAVASVCGVVVLGSTILYSNMGRPDLPSVARAPSKLVLGQDGQGQFQPAATGTTAASGARGAPQAEAAASQPAAQPGTAQRVGSLDEMIQRLVDRAQKEPGKAETWRMLGWSHSAIGRFGDAVEAYGKAVALEPRNAGLQSALGEAIARAADGKVTPAAVAAIDAALAIDPGETRARYVKGHQLEQSGAKKEALDLWVALAKDAGPNDSWAGELSERIAALARELNVDVAGAAAATAASQPPLQLLKPNAGGSGERGPTAQQVKEAEALPQADRSAMIRSMVDGLAKRLENSPRDADGWIQLIRSRKVLGETDAAKAALSRAIGVFSDAPQERSRIAAAAAEVGVTQ